MRTTETVRVKLTVVSERLHRTLRYHINILSVFFSFAFSMLSTYLLNPVIALLSSFISELYYSIVVCRCIV